LLNGELWSMMQLKLNIRTGHTLVAAAGQGICGWQAVRY
jgi:hypothetical protein